jgi:chaperone required for assembly of F1-ATPase
MSEWARKRVWTKTGVAEGQAGFEVTLDGRPIRTPSKTALVLPTRALADMIAAEWDAQEDTIDPTTMPATRMANSTIDKVVPQRPEVEAHLAGYGETDLLCYRADGPDGLVARQADIWDPILDWIATTHGARLVITQGVIPKAQNPECLQALAQPMNGFTDFELTGFHDLVTLSGSLVLGYAAALSQDTPESIWEASRVDELWQIEQWGQDDEAERANLLKKQAFLDAKAFLSAAGKAGE